MRGSLDHPGKQKASYGQRGASNGLSGKTIAQTVTQMLPLDLGASRILLNSLRARSSVG